MSSEGPLSDEYVKIFVQHQLKVNEAVMRFADSILEWAEGRDKDVDELQKALAGLREDIDFVADTKKTKDHNEP